MNERRELEMLVGRYGFCLAGKGRCTDAASACWSFFEIVVHSELRSCDMVCCSTTELSIDSSQCAIIDYVARIYKYWDLENKDILYTE